MVRAGGAPKHEPRGAATPCGECAGRAARHGLRRRRGRAGKAGRSAAARAGGADGPTAPTSWGPGRAGAPTPQPARGRSEARPAKRPACGLGLAARKGAPEQRRRPTCPGRACPALAATLPGLPQAGRAGGGTAAAQGGQGVGPQAGGAGGTWPGAPGHGREPLSLGAIRQRERKEGVPTGHSLLFADKGHTASCRKVRYLPPPPLCQVPYIGHFQYRGESTQGLCPCTPAHGLCWQSLVCYTVKWSRVS